MLLLYVLRASFHVPVIKCTNERAHCKASGNEVVLSGPVVPLVVIMKLRIGQQFGVRRYVAKNARYLIKLKHDNQYETGYKDPVNTNAIEN